MYKTFLFFILLTQFSCFSNCKTFLLKFNETNPNRISVGPDIFLFDFKTCLEEVKIEGKKVFGGGRFGYEYLRPQFIYFGGECFVGRTHNNFCSTFEGIDLPNQKNIGFGNFDLRLGYTFPHRVGMIIPFLGFGGYAFGHRNFGFKESAFYYEAGIRTLFEIWPTCNIGFNAKVFSTVEREKKFKHLDLALSEHRDIRGSEIGMPIVTLICCWDVQLEPYFLIFHKCSNQKIYGARLLFGYRF